jgi:predicted RNA binding protein YcfA (HicA-like mRNA interferase family)
MHSREIIKRLEANGWYHVATSGDHWQYRHPAKQGRVTVQHPRRDVPIGTLKSIERQSGLKLR